MRNLVVQLWGVGNLIQTEPLLRQLGGGVLMVNGKRGTMDLAPLFPDWEFIDCAPRMVMKDFDDVYLCGPWLQPSTFGKLGKRVHSPVWTMQGGWEKTEAEVLGEMAGLPGDPYPPRLPRLDTWSKGQIEPYVVVSCGYNKHEDGWEFKDWEDLPDAVMRLQELGIKTVGVGTREECNRLGDFCTEQFIGEPFMNQVRFASACSGYLGNDTGWAHICGAYGLPAAVYYKDPKRQDVVKNRPASPALLQFGDARPIEDTVQWLAAQVALPEEDKSLSG